MQLHKWSARWWGTYKAMDCYRLRVLACTACACDHWNAIDSLWVNHVYNKLIDGRDAAHSLDANVAHSTKKSIGLIGQCIVCLKSEGPIFFFWCTLPIVGSHFIRSTSVSCYVTSCPVHTCNHRLITIFVLCVLSTRANIMWMRPSCHAHRNSALQRSNTHTRAHNQHHSQAPQCVYDMAIIYYLQLS